MSRNILIGFVFALGSSISFASAQDRPAKPPGAAYKVAFWYEADRPTILKYQVYDLSKGEYDPKAVEGWLRTIRTKYPNHGAYVRDIRTDGETGATAKERLAGAIEGEKRRWADLQRQILPPLPNLVIPFESSRSQRTSTGRSSFDRPSPGSPGGHANPPTSPIPYPYRSRPL